MIGLIIWLSPLGSTLRRTYATATGVASSFLAQICAGSTLRAQTSPARGLIMPLLSAPFSITQYMIQHHCEKLRIMRTFSGTRLEQAKRRYGTILCVAK